MLYNTPMKKLQPSVILGVVAHPDDIEFGMAGSVAKWISQGAEVYYYVLTNGNKGSADRSISPEKLRDIRRDEQRAAAAILGVKEVFFSDYDDGTLEVSMELKREIVRKIRSLKPQVLITFDPTMAYDAESGFVNHPDHRAAGQAALDALFPLARDHLSFPELLQDESLEPHKVETALLMNFCEHNYFEDISAFMDIKLEALAAHSSQIPDWQAAKELVCSMGKKAGAMAGCDFAEAFVRIDVR